MPTRTLTTNLLCLAAIFFALALMCARLGADTTVTAEIDVGPAIDPLQDQVDQLHAENTQLQAQVDDHAQRLYDIEQALTDPTTPAPPIVIDPTPPGPGPGQFLNRGMGLAPVTYYTAEWTFTDLMLTTQWRDLGGGRSLGFNFKKGHPPAGPYVCTWDGSGSIAFTLGAKVTASAPNRIELVIQADAPGIDLVKTGDVRNARLVPALQVDSVFHPTFVDRLRPFKVIRFMDWQQTNNAPARAWSDRTRPGDSQITGKGVAVEHMVTLVNELQADPWFCMPHLADDDYVRAFATLVRDRLHPDATVYVEWSNEVWNAQFKQAQWLKGGDDQYYTNGYFSRWGTEARRDFTIWREVFAGQEHRVVRVLATHLQNPWLAGKIVEAMPNGSIDALAPSGYFGLTRKQFKAMPAGVTPEQLIETLAKNIQDDNTGWYHQHGLIAQDLGVPLVVYEGGQHLTPNGQDNLPWVDAMLGVQQHPGMLGLYRQNLAAFHDAGGSLFVAFNYVSQADKQWGQWGHLLYQDQRLNDAPKYRAVTEQ